MNARRLLQFSQLFAVSSLMAGPMTAAADPTYDDVMSDAKPQMPCTFDEQTSKCHGFPRGDLWEKRNEPANAKALAEWARSLTFVKKKSAVYRPPKQALEIAQIDDIETLWLRNLGDVAKPRQAVFVAQISADLSQAPDADYGTGKTNFPVYREFYIVIDEYIPDKTKYKHDSYKAGTFSIYGVGTFQGSSGPETRLVQVGKLKGKFRICGQKHSDEVKKQGAQFLSCAAQMKQSVLLKDNPSLANALGNRSLHDAISRLDSLPSRRDLLSANAAIRRKAFQAGLDLFLPPARLDAKSALASTLLKLLMDTSDSPAWMPCGVGCCTADDKA